MELPRATPKQLLRMLLVITGAVLTLLMWIQWRGTQSVVHPHSYELKAQDLAGWQAFGGSWAMANGVVQNNSNERGAKLLTGSDAWGNYTINSDIRFSGVSADMGVIVRSNNESRGVDAFNGYYVGLRSLDETLVIGRANYGWVEARPVPMPGGVHPAEWYRLKVTAYGCKIAASAENLRTSETAWVAFKERSCIKSGRIGLRSLNAGMWRNVSISPAGFGDYRALQTHADSIEQPVVLKGPPWWTPWHVAVSLASTVLLALLIQLSYFRVRQWTMDTIMQERERLAHDIHDTMAQSFAGVGYQIQGIRSSLKRGDHADLKQIPDQLDVAYQLVRKCHEDASRTIAMLAPSYSEIQEDLLDVLKQTAKQIAGEGIQTFTELRGEKVTLSLRLADALLHIGQESIANAVSHSDLTVLRIALTFESDFVELVIDDNGRGFDYDPELTGFGILGMQKRTREVSGTLTIKSTVGHGAKVCVVAPLKQHRFRERFADWATKKA